MDRLLLVLPSSSLRGITSLILLLFVVYVGFFYSVILSINRILLWQHRLPVLGRCRETTLAIMDSQPKLPWNDFNVLSS